MTQAVQVLLVEDSETQALQMRAMLEGAGFAVARAPSGEAALEAMAEVRPDVLLVDYHLPGMNGDELVRLVRLSAATRALPILMLTGRDTRARELQGLESGASAYVPKSSDQALLLGRLRALVRQREGAEAAAPSPRFRRGALLLVTADPACRAAFEPLLAGEGYRVAHAADAADAAARVAAAAVDAVLVDLGDGSDAGFALLADVARLRGQGGGFELVALGHERQGSDLTLRGFALGADDVLPKSEDRETQAARVRAVVRRKIARDEEARAAEHERQREAALERARAEAAGADALAAANRELAAANARLSATQAQLVQAAKMASLGELVAGIAHEINNPLAFLLAHQATVRRLIGEEVDDASPRLAARLSRAGERLDAMKGGLSRIQQLVIKLRRFSRLDEGDRVATEIPESIEAVLTLLEPKLGRILVERDYAARPTLVCSAALINQVVMNILSNAADALADGGTIGIATRERDGAYEIAIHDDGPGVPPAIRSRIFEPFYTTKDIGVGTGLGLAIAYGVVRSHGGEIRIDDGPRGGALFTIAVPAVEE